MHALAWLLIPLVTGIGASVWGWCAGRPRRSDVWTDVERYDRLRAAFTRPAP
ncbi:hypothetical protein ACFOOM_33015 [Streptomyces echinoruber]|uniref:Uncharacterized protein n=1 Tax=Streptomyces echinoruber TaxID=68898 RepID=A0A918RS85_9ACTN|nr:hypothetical protein [Streptomyces echinoruber]GHA07754.1 hypothetical protein GCM10010389_53770 [Streptomyces echinoruber]